MTEDSESSTSRLRSSNNILHEEEDEVSQSSSSDDSDSYEPLNLNADTGESVGLADEELNIISFFGESDGIFSTVEAMFEHCHRKHDLDFIKLVKEHGVQSFLKCRPSQPGPSVTESTASSM